MLGAVLGAVNGFFVTVLGCRRWPVTIGTLALYRGLAFVVLGDGAVADFPVQLHDWVTGTIGGVVPERAASCSSCWRVLFGVVLHATPFGRSVYAIGANEQAARFSGIRVDRLKFWLYVASGAVAGLAGVLWTLRYSSARADNGAGHRAGRRGRGTARRRVHLRRRGHPARRARRRAAARHAAERAAALPTSPTRR